MSRMLTGPCQGDDGRYVQIKIDDKIVLMRKEDYLLNASQILTLTNKNFGDIIKY